MEYNCVSFYEHAFLKLPIWKLELRIIIFIYMLPVSNIRLRTLSIFLHAKLALFFFNAPLQLGTSYTSRFLKIILKFIETECPIGSINTTHQPTIIVNTLPMMEH